MSQSPAMHWSNDGEQTYGASGLSQLSFVRSDSGHLMHVCLVRQTGSSHAGAGSQSSHAGAGT